MVALGKVQNGVVVFDGEAPPEGTHVVVSFGPPDRPKKSGVPVKLPLVWSDAPASVEVTKPKIALILDDEDVSAGR